MPEIKSIKKTAEDFAKEQKEISISEFFEKNKHLLGFDNPTKALLMTVKEACDNSLDACEEAGILPDITVKLKQTGEDKFRVTVQDNGPGIVKEQIPKIFGKLFDIIAMRHPYFFCIVQSRKHQGRVCCVYPLYRRYPILFRYSSGNFSAEKMRDDLMAVAQSEDRDAELKDFRIRL